MNFPTCTFLILIAAIMLTIPYKRTEAEYTSRICPTPQTVPKEFLTKVSFQKLGARKEKPVKIAVIITPRTEKATIRLLPARICFKMDSLA